MKYVGVAIAMVLVACKPCDDSCEEIVELAFVPAAGMLASTAYTITLSADGDVVRCEIEVSSALDEERACEGDDAVVLMSDGSQDDTTGGGVGGARRVVVRWGRAPAQLDLVVRNADSTLVTDNTLTPAYQDQGVMACDGECRRFESEIVLTM